MTLSLISFSQNRATWANYTGDWETPTSWNPTWDNPLTSNIVTDITINGFILCNSSLTFSQTTQTLHVNDTLIIYGNLNLENSSSLIVHPNGIIIVYGNLTAINNATIEMYENAYFVVTGNYIKTASGQQGSFLSYNDLSNVFIGGSVYKPSNMDPLLFPVLNCPGAYTFSNCAYGNLQDIKYAPIYDFFLSTCITEIKPVITPDGPLNFCNGESVTLSSNLGSDYIWTTGETSQSINVTSSGEYAVRVADATGCFSKESSITEVIVHELPQPTIDTDDPLTQCAGNEISTELTVDIAKADAYQWLLDGVPLSNADEYIYFASGQGIYSVKVALDGCTGESNELTISIIPLPEPSIFTEDGLTYCDGEIINVTLFANINEASSYQWLLNGSPIESPDNSTYIATEAGEYSLDVNMHGCSGISNKITITLDEIPIANAGFDQELNFENKTQMNAALLSSEIGEWSILTGFGMIENIHSPVSIITDLSPGENIFLWTVKSEKCSAADSVIIRVNDLFLPQVITPNGDGKNDFFVINNIEKNSPVELTIYNRWGNEVYSNSNYNNEWNGNSNKGSELANDTYFYVLRFGDGTIAKSFVIIRR